MGKKLLIVDDDNDIVEVIKAVLVDSFTLINGANGVDEALMLLKRTTYSLIFLDINLGKRNGAEIIKFLIEESNNLNKETPFVIISGIITPQFVDRYQNKFAGILMKPFNNDDILNIVSAIDKLSQDKFKIPLDQLAAEDIPYAKCDLPFPVVQMEQRVNRVLEQVRKSARLSQLFTDMKIDRDTDNYLFAHIGMIINIASAICINLEWNTDKTLEKFIFAAYLHDMALAQRSDLAKISSLEELEKRRNYLTPTEYRLVYEHPNIAANTVESIPEIPMDVSVIIRQHHEMSKRNGFPTKCGYQKIVPLSVIFIIAHDFADYILSISNWNAANLKKNIEDYNDMASERYQGIHFSKMLKILLSLVKA